MMIPDMVNISEAKVHDNKIKEMMLIEKLVDFSILQPNILSRVSLLSGFSI